MYLAIAAIAVFIGICMLDHLPDSLQDEVKPGSVWDETIDLLIATVNMNKDIRMILLIPLFIANSLFFSYFTADWPKVML